MYKKTINHIDEKGTVVYTVYNREEADAAGVKYKDWRVAKEGEYMVTDDGYVAKIIKKKEYSELGTDRIGVYYYTPVGTMIWHKKYNNTKFKAGTRKAIHTLSGKTEQDNLGRNAKNRALARWYALSGDFAFSVQMAFGDVSAATGKRLRVIAKLEGFKKMVTEEMKVLLDENGFGKADTMKYLKEAVDMAKEKGNVNGLIRLVENMIELNQMNKPEVEKNSLMLGMSTQQALLDTISSEEAGMMAMVTKKFDDMEDVSDEE